MKRLFFMIIPVVIVLLAFHPVTEITVTGTVTDENSGPLPGVTISVKGTSRSTVSAQDGTYTIKIPSAKSVLVFTGIGLTAIEEKVAGRTIINVSIARSDAALNEVLVVGYGRVRKKDIAGTVSAVKSAEYYGFAAASPGSQLRMDDHRGYPGQPGEGQGTFNTEDYDPISENKFLPTSGNPVSTFSIDVDAASYSNIRRMLTSGSLPPAGAVRIEEMVNYFKYDYEQPTGNDPFAIHTEISQAPWNPKHKLVMIGLQGKKIPVENLPPANLVFLVDVSGSMESPEKLGLVKSSLKLLADQLRPQDKVAMVVYAGAAGLVLKPTSDKTKIREALENLAAGGSTAGGEGLRLAYKTAREQMVKGSNNRVILCTDGDFNVGESSNDAMVTLIEKERESGIFLTVLGYGMGNYKDNKMQLLADKGNGNHAYIDGLSEARKVLVNEFGGTLFTIAKDVKLQVEFNPAKVQGYRLIGYENRMLAKEDFNDDKKDAGELGSGHTVTALYEIIPAGVKSEFLQHVKVDDLKYQPGNNTTIKPSDEIMTVKFRYKDPAGDVSKLITHPLADNEVRFASTSDNFRFAASVAEFGMLLRKSEFRSAASFANVIENARAAKGADDEGYRTEFIKMVRDAQLLSGKTAGTRDELTIIK